MQADVRPHTGNLPNILLGIFVPLFRFQSYIQDLLMHFLLKNKTLTIFVCLEVMGKGKFYIKHTGDLVLVDKDLEAAWPPVRLATQCLVFTLKSFY